MSNLGDPERVKEFIAGAGWSNGYKDNITMRAQTRTNAEHSEQLGCLQNRKNAPRMSNGFELLI